MKPEGTVLLNLTSDHVLVFWRKGSYTGKGSYTLEVFANEGALADAVQDDPDHYYRAEYLSVGDTWVNARSCRAFMTVKR